MSIATTDQGRAAFTWGDPDEELAGLPDDQILDQYLGDDETASEAAFRMLVRRHGPMVMGVCRHILDHLQDAEDAFQATFLVLARKAATVNDRRVLARWLYEVAYRVAIRSSAQRATARRLQERQEAEMAAHAASSQDSDPEWIELRPMIHEEVNRLPAKYRTAVVLCYLEGRTNEEAAAMLSWPVGTVKGRLSRAREMLRSRLTRRGLGLSAMFLLSRLARNEAFAEVVPSRLIEQTVGTARLVKRGVGLGGSPGEVEVSERIARLAEDEPPAPALSVFSKRRVVVLVMAVLVAALIMLGLAAAPTWGGTVGGPWSRLLDFRWTSPAGAARSSCHSS